MNKYIVLAIITLSLLSIAKMTSFICYDASNITNGVIDIKYKEFRDYDIHFKAANADASINVETYNDLYGRSGADLESYFVSSYDVEDKWGNHFVKLNKFYVCMEQDNDGKLDYKISKNKVDDNYFVCPYFLDKDGNEIDYAYYGKYLGYVNTSTENLCSINNVTPTYNIFIGNFRTYAKNNGDQYHQTDWCTVFLTQIMCMVRYGTTDSSKILSYRTYGQNTGTGTKILGIEDIVGNGYQWVDGINVTTTYTCYDTKISDYQNETQNNKTEINCMANGNTKTMNYIDKKPVFSILGKTAGAAATTYYCDACEIDQTSYPMFWGAWAHTDDCGLFYTCTGTFQHQWEKTEIPFTSGTTRLHAKYLVTE